MVMNDNMQVPVVQWALANDCTWGEWQCSKLAPELYTGIDKQAAADLFAFAHKHGCPCTCTAAPAPAQFA
jgi:hypothetical protein